MFYARKYEKYTRKGYFITYLRCLGERIKN